MQIMDSLIRRRSNYPSGRVDRACHFVVSTLIIRMERPRTGSRTLRQEQGWRCYTQAIDGQRPFTHHSGQLYSKTMSIFTMLYQPSSFLEFVWVKGNHPIDMSIRPWLDFLTQTRMLNYHTSIHSGLQCMSWKTHYKCRSHTTNGPTDHVLVSIYVNLRIIQETYH